MGELIIVSNRGPFNFSEDLLREADRSLKEGTRPRIPAFGDGGLVQAMAGLLKGGEWDITWLSASIGDRDIDVARGHYSKLFKRMAKEDIAPRFFPLIDIDQDARMRFRYRDYNFFMRFVFFDTRHMHGYYDKFANGFVWPLMHLTRSPLLYKKSKTFPRPHFEKNDFVQYMSSGVTFANTVIDEIRKCSEFKKTNSRIVIWNQDYHLMRIAEAHKSLLEGQEIPKEKRKGIKVGQFIHTPFFNIHEIQGLIREDKRARVKEQAYDPFGENLETALQKLTWGMLSNDFIGFHTKEYCDHYLESLEEWFPVKIRVKEKFYEVLCQGHITTIGAFPIGLDVDRVLSEVYGRKRLHWKIGREDLFQKIHRDRKDGRFIFGGIERCDYTKGLVERLNVFLQAVSLLKKGPRAVRLYQVTAPSRMESPHYKHLHHVVKEEAAKINNKFHEGLILLLDEGIPPPQNYRFMKEMDVMLVTPLEDGMNLVALEYILSQKYKAPEKRGILVLGICGASRVLKEKGFGEQDGIIYIDPMKPRHAGAKIAGALKAGRRLSDRIIKFVQQSCRVDTWAEKNIEAILNSKET